METSQFNNNEKEQRIQELFEQSIEKCDRAAKKQKSLMIPFGVVLACLVFFAWGSSTLSIIWRVCGATAIMLLYFISSWFNSRMSKAHDVNELLSVNDKDRKKLAIYSTIVMILAFAIIYGFAYLYGTMKPNIIIAILMIVLCAMCYITTSRDCREVREIKRLKAEK